MQNEATFHIIGRIGKIDIREKVAFLSVAANRNYQKDGEWQQQTLWNDVTVFHKRILKQLENANTGDLVRVAGILYRDEREVDGEKVYSTKVVAEGFAILTPKSATDDGSE